MNSSPWPFSAIALAATFTLAAGVPAGGSDPVEAAGRATPRGPVSTARYRVTFDATWSAATHPDEFPAFAHFSGLIGGTHDSTVRFWIPGQAASNGIKAMAEMGLQSPLAAEINAAVARGQAERVMSGGGIEPSPGSVSLDFDIGSAFPLVTLVSMIAPSPDWFVGVSALDLLEEGLWVDEVRVELYPWDAGTDSGITYTSPDQPTVPRQPIARILGRPLLNNGRVAPLGTFAFRRLSRSDADVDGLPDDWEIRYGLDPGSAAGNDGAAGDPDADGRTNAEELADASHPRGFAPNTRYLAEGATGTFFSTRIALANPGMQPARTLLRFFNRDGTRGSRFVDVPALARRTVDVEGVAGEATAEVSTVVESDAPVVVDRAVSWPRGQAYGRHDELGLASPSTDWYLAEGATHSGFQLFYLLQNPNAADAKVEVTYLLPAGRAPVVRTYTVPGRSRFNIWVNQEAAAAPALANAEVSAVLRSTNLVPILVERSMYLDAGGLPFGAGHASAGVVARATHWFLAEGATGAYFDLFLLLANPSDAEAEVTITYFLPGGTTLRKSRLVPARSRATVWVDREDPLLADTAVSSEVSVTNNVPIVVERSMWWPGPTAASWQEAHDSAGSTMTGTAWAIAGGEVGGPPDHLETYLLVANPSPAPASVRVTLFFEDGRAPVARLFDVPARSRFNVNVREIVPSAGSFGAIVESLGADPARIVVERSIYGDALGVRWAAGGNAPATRLR